MPDPGRTVAVGLVAVLAGLGAAVANDVAPFSEDVAPFSEDVAAMALPRPRVPVPDFPLPRPTFRVPFPDLPTPRVPFPDAPTPRGPFPDWPPPTGAPPPPGMVDALTDPWVSDDIKRAVATLRTMAAKGTEDEKLIARATCTVLNDAAESEPDHARFKELILEQAGPSSSSWSAWLRDRYADKVANLLTVAHPNARAGLWYAQYCLRP